VGRGNPSTVPCLPLAPREGLGQPQLLQTTAHCLCFRQPQQQEMFAAQSPLQACVELAQPPRPGKSQPWGWG